MNEHSTSIMCPLCHYRAVVPKFVNDVCPQCRRKVDPTKVVTEILAPTSEHRLRHIAPTAKEFVYDQKGGSNNDSPSSSSIARMESEGKLHGFKGRL